MEEIRWALGVGTDASDFTALQVCLRALLVYLAGLAILRAENRFLGKETALDILLGFVLGSLLSRSINGSAPLGASIAGAVALVGLHRGLASLAFRFPGFGALVKGRPRPLVRDGEIDWDGMRRQRITRRDLDEALRLKAHLDDPAKVREARFERNGEISVLPREEARPPRVVDVAVEKGVQTVRIVLG